MNHTYVLQLLGVIPWSKTKKEPHTNTGQPCPHTDPQGTEITLK